MGDLLTVYFFWQVNTNVQQSGPNQFYLTLEQVESINHIVVFLTGQVPFSAGFGGSVFFGWPVGNDVSWQLLGFISNEKPSAIFKISKVKPHEAVQNPFSQEMMDTVSQLSSTTALIGISVESLDQIAQQVPSADTQASTVDSFTEFTQKMLENFFNYASSFAVAPTPATLNPTETYIPSSVLQQWYMNFQRRLQTNPNFWKSM